MRCAPRRRCARTQRFTQEYYAPDKRYIGNAVQVFFKDGTSSPRVQVDYPIGHRKRRAEGMPVLVKKFEASVAAHFGAKQTEAIKKMFADRAALAGDARQRFHGADGERRLTLRRRRAKKYVRRRPDYDASGLPKAPPSLGIVC